jgi:hypothetical protein
VVDAQCFPPPQQQLIPAIAVIEVMAVVAVVATTDTMPTIEVQQPQPQGAPAWGIPGMVGPGGCGAGG